MLLIEYDRTIKRVLTVDDCLIWYSSCLCVCGIHYSVMITSRRGVSRPSILYSPHPSPFKTASLSRFSVPSVLVQREWTDGVAVRRRTSRPVRLDLCRVVHWLSPVHRRFSPCLPVILPPKIQILNPSSTPARGPA